MSNRHCESSAIINEKTYPWLADIPDEWGGAKQNVIRELDKVLHLCGSREKFMLPGATSKPIRNNRFINIETKHRLLDHYARWPEMVSSAYGKYPFTYHDNGTEKAVGLDHFIKVLKLRYSQSMSIFAFYERLAHEGLIDPEKIKRVFDLGSGGWSYAFVMPIAFPNFQTAVGLEKGEEWEPFEKLWRPVFNLNNEQFVLCAKNFFELEKPSSKKTLEDNFRKHGNTDLAQIFMFKPEGVDQSYQKLFYQIGERLNPEGVLVVHVKGEDEYVVKNMRQSLMDIEHTELVDWHTDVRPSGEIGPDEARVFVVKQTELLKIKELMEKSAAQIVETSKSPWDAISTYNHLLQLDKDNPGYLLQQAKAYLAMLPGDLRIDQKAEPLYNVSNSSHTIARFFETIMRVASLDTQNEYLQETDKMLTDVFCKIAIGSLARTYPKLETAWSFDEKRAYSRKLLKPFNAKEHYDEIFKGTFGVSTRDLPLSLTRKEFESIYQVHQKNEEGSPAEYLVKSLFMSISRITRETIQAGSGINSA